MNTRMRPDMVRRAAEIRSASRVGNTRMEA
jgi:hypothetical protein